MFNHVEYHTVYPEDCNFHNEGKMIHGGQCLKWMDRAAANCCKLLLDTELYALTVGVDNVIFSKPARLGDLIKITVTYYSLGIKRISLYVTCIAKNGDILSSGIFHFCSFKNGVSCPHNLEL